MRFFSDISSKYKIDKTTHIKALNSIIFRGPDASEDIEGDNFWQGFNWLAIIDLNSRSSKPFFKFNEKFILLFNG